MSSVASSTGAGSSTRPAYAKRLERVASALIGLSLIAVSIPDSFGPDRVAVQRIAAILGVLVGVLLIVRKPAKHNGSNAQIAAALPSLIVGSLLLRLLIGSQPTWWMLAISTTGAILSVTAFGTLGKSFAVLPSRRDVVTRGPYKFLRHPAYLGQWLVMTGCAGAAAPPWLGLALAVGLLPWLALRAVAEERLLSEDPVYVRYMETVQWRIIPGIW
ncbi:MAG: protein-S-isoprenylcysteine O-methyltransferase Ste14 [Bradymonadia bacterium]|jgi:protein-S-isoprenylcysteine O-methyltransferase Ste14